MAIGENAPAHSCYEGHVDHRVQSCVKKDKDGDCAVVVCPPRTSASLRVVFHTHHGSPGVPFGLDFMDPTWFLTLRSLPVFHSSWRCRRVLVSTDIPLHGKLVHRCAASSSPLLSAPFPPSVFTSRVPYCLLLPTPFPSPEKSSFWFHISWSIAFWVCFILYLTQWFLLPSGFLQIQLLCSSLQLNNTALCIHTTFSFSCHFVFVFVCLFLYYI